MIKKLDHIAIVVKDLGRAMGSYSKGLCMETEKILEIPEVQMRIGILRVGTIKIELLEFGSPDLPTVKATGGDRVGLNHVCYEVNNLEVAICRMESEGFKLIEGFPRKGIHGRIAFLIPPHASEERIEILEAEPENE